MLVGPSGVGKTETAMTLAELLYGGDQNMTVINMSEFKEEHKVSLLMGSPPGYVGYGEGGVLTEAVRRRPYSVVLLDEIEKAHPGVQDIFYQVFDKGMLRDGEGRDIDFKNTLIMMTSNAGTDMVMSFAPTRKPARRGRAGRGHASGVLKIFKPAFLGRVMSFPISRSTTRLRGIVELQLGRIRRRVEKPIGLSSLTTRDGCRIARDARKLTRGTEHRPYPLASLLPELSDFSSPAWRTAIRSSRSTCQWRKMGSSSISLPDAQIRLPRSLT